MKLPYTDLPIGIDMGLKHFMTDSHGDVVDNPRFFRKSHGRLKKNSNVSRKGETRAIAGNVQPSSWARLIRRFATSAVIFTRRNLEY